ncbi:unnamed protein product [Pleuronectes platessa]|uniref:Uncharacterized protein n=1 Tax=Pleuronectes platessa TaxID=8262 RepID=A0A9N7W3Z2_PLEPL|nr:unnamed protein product [Pleuronectes platessa]
MGTQFVSAITPAWIWTTGQQPSIEVRTAPADVPLALYQRDRCTKLKFCWTDRTTCHLTASLRRAQVYASCVLLLFINIPALWASSAPVQLVLLEIAAGIETSAEPWTGGLQNDLSSLSRAGISAQSSVTLDGTFVNGPTTSVERPQVATWEFLSRCCPHRLPRRSRSSSGTYHPHRLELGWDSSQRDLCLSRKKQPHEKVDNPSGTSPPQVPCALLRGCTEVLKHGNSARGTMLKADMQERESHQRGGRHLSPRLIQKVSASPSRSSVNKAESCLEVVKDNWEGYKPLPGVPHMTLIAHGATGFAIERAAEVKVSLRVTGGRRLTPVQRCCENILQRAWLKRDADGQSNSITAAKAPPGLSLSAPPSSPSYPPPRDFPSS